MLASLLVGLVAGAIAVALVGLAQKARQALRYAASARAPIAPRDSPGFAPASGV